MRRILLVHLVLASILSSGAECGRAEVACVDFSGRTLEVSVVDAESCLSYPESRVCSSFRLPDRLLLRVTDEPVQRRELQCEAHRAEIVEGDFGDLEFLGPADGTLVVSGDFAVAERVRVAGTECYGRFFVSLARIGALERGDPEYWLSPEADIEKWAFAYEFIPTDDVACAGIQSACDNSHCFADVRNIE